MSKIDKKQLAYERSVREKTEMRTILLLANERVKCKDMYSFYAFISSYTPIKEGFMKYVKFELVQKSIREDYLVEIWIDENQLFHAVDISETDNWYKEMREKKHQRLMNAFWVCDECDIDIL